MILAMMMMRAARRKIPSIPSALSAAAADLEVLPVMAMTDKFEFAAQSKPEAEHLYSMRAHS